VTAKLIDFGTISSPKEVETKVSQKKAVLGLTPGYITLAEWFLHSHFKWLNHYLRFQGKNILTKQKVQDIFIKELGVYCDSTFIEKIAREVKSKYPEALKHDSSHYSDSWNSFSDDWKYAFIEYIKHYEKNSADVYALGTILNNAKLRMGYRFPFRNIERLNDENPFTRPKIDEVWSLIN